MEDDEIERQLIFNFDSDCHTKARFSWMTRVGEACTNIQQITIKKNKSLSFYCL
jgi:hypothetical protein